jgi:hypothetical protein
MDSMLTMNRPRQGHPPCCGGAVPSLHRDPGKELGKISAYLIDRPVHVIFQLAYLWSGISRLGCGNGGTKTYEAGSVRLDLMTYLLTWQPH